MSKGGLLWSPSWWRPEIQRGHRHSRRALGWTPTGQVAGEVNHNCPQMALCPFCLLWPWRPRGWGAASSSSVGASLLSNIPVPSPVILSLAIMTSSRSVTGLADAPKCRWETPAGTVAPATGAPGPCATHFPQELSPAGQVCLPLVPPRHSTVQSSLPH